MKKLQKCIVIWTERSEWRNLFTIFAPEMKTKRQIDIMGIVNLTDDSYFAQSRCPSSEDAVSRIGMLLDEGADIIDIGACSTRPGSRPVGADEEWRRLEPVLRKARKDFPDARFSIDTCWSSVVRNAYGLIGDFIVNDISAGEDDPDMLSVVGDLGLQYVAMHKRGTPEIMQCLTDYQDVTQEVVSYFRDFAIRAEAAGVKDWILDPGFGFAKTVEQNWQLLRDLGEILRFDQNDNGSQNCRKRRCLVGVSRKSMIYKPLGITPEDALPATQGAHMLALINGADILRVHDVKEARQVAALFNMMA